MKMGEDNVFGMYLPGNCMQLAMEIMGTLLTMPITKLKKTFKL